MPTLFYRFSRLQFGTSIPERRWGVLLAVATHMAKR
jgi:hypothetical protein